MSAIYEGPAQVAFSLQSRYDVTNELSLTPCTVTIVELSAGTYEATIFGGAPRMPVNAYLRVVLPDGTEHGGRITSMIGSTFAFLGNIIL